MYLIDQRIVNSIARSVPMKYPQMYNLFKMTEEEADKAEDNLISYLEEKKVESEAARAITAFLPLYLENQAITNYLNKTNRQNLRSILPEILTVEEMASIASRDRMLTQTQTTQVMQATRELQKALLQGLNIW